MVMTALITGANRGIGLALTQHYVSKGCRVIACCRRPDSATTLQSLNVEICHLDVAKQESINALKIHLNHTPIDLLINNAGIMGGSRQSFRDIDYVAWEKTFITNTFGPYRMIEAFADNIAGSTRKIAANISSLMGSITSYDRGDKYIYRSSKTALNMVTLNLSIDLKDRGIILLALHPGWVKTDMGGDEAPLTPGDSAAGLATIIQNANPSISGQFFSYDGSRLSW